MSDCEAPSSGSSIAIPTGVVKGDGISMSSAVAGSDFVQPVTAPATGTSTGIKLQVATDGTYLYVCTAANTWKRVLISGF